MATEQLANSAQTTLVAALDSATTSVVVLSASLFPTTAPFRVRVDELMLVTAASGASWTVARGIESTAAAAHNSGATVTQVLTATLMNELTPLVAAQSANAVFAGPMSGATAAPTFRAIGTADLPDGGVTYAKIQSLSAGSLLLGSGSAGAGPPQEISLGSGLSLSGTTLSASGGGSVTSVDVSGGTTGLTATGGPVTASGTITLGGTLAVAGGGTGATTAAAARRASGSAPRRPKTPGPAGPPSRS